MEIKLLLAAGIDAEATISLKNRKILFRSNWFLHKHLVFSARPIYSGFFLK